MKAAWNGLGRVGMVPEKGVYALEVEELGVPWGAGIEGWRLRCVWRRGRRRDATDPIVHEKQQWTHPAWKPLRMPCTLYRTTAGKWQSKSSVIQLELCRFDAHGKMIKKKMVGRVKLDMAKYSTEDPITEKCMLDKAAFSGSSITFTVTKRAVWDDEAVSETCTSETVYSETSVFEAAPIPDRPWQNQSNEDDKESLQERLTAMESLIRDLRRRNQLQRRSSSGTHNIEEMEERLKTEQRLRMEGRQREAALEKRVSALEQQCTMLEKQLVDARVQLVDAVDLINTREHAHLNAARRNLSLLSFGAWGQK